MCAWKLAISLVDHGAGLSGKSVIFCCLGSDRADIGKTLLRQRHASGDMAGLAHIHVERKYGVRATLLGPAHHPAERRFAEFGAQKAALGADDGIA
jgi:hypothetical protein